MTLLGNLLSYFKTGKEHEVCDQELIMEAVLNKFFRANYFLPNFDTSLLLRPKCPWPPDDQTKIELYVHDSILCSNERQKI